MNTEKTAKTLKQNANVFPVTDCSKPAHPRHQAVHHELKICFTRNKNGTGDDTYNLSIQHPERKPSNAEINPLLPFFFNRKNGPVEELQNITTPNVRCFSQKT